MEKILNSRCICGQGLPWIKSLIIMLEPCEHMLHKNCYNKNKKCCPLCQNKVTKFNTIHDLKKKNSDIRYISYDNYQKYIDIISMSNFDNLYKLNDDINVNAKILHNTIDLLGIISTVPFLSGFDDGHSACCDVLNIMNAKLVINGYDYIKNANPKSPKVFIANHTSHLDFIILFYLLKCGFLSSSSIKDFWLGRRIMNIIPLLLIERGKDVNTVDKMRKYVKENGSICLFPEGMITHPETLIKFRTGAFHIGYPVYPITINYDPVIYDTDTSILLKKITSDPHITIRINILKPELPPFNDKKIENIRLKMANRANLALSRVSNKDIVDISGKKN